MRNSRLYIQDILESMNDILLFIENLDKEAFIKDKKTSSAVIMKLEVIGEACKSVPHNIKDAYQDIPWKEMAGMRDRLIHAYFGVDLNLVWQTASKVLPDLIPKIDNILKDNNHF